MRYTHLLPVATLLGAAPAFVWTETASAQMREIEPKWVVVTQDGAALRAGDMDRFYKVDELEAGEVLRMDAQSDRWGRVLYPGSLTAFVRASDAERIPGDRVRLTTEERLRAANMHVGLAGSWQVLYAEPLPAGTELRVVEPLRDEQNQVIGYRVVPPGQDEVGQNPYGYVRLSQVRDATEEEVAAHLEALKNPRPAARPAEAARPGQDRPAATPPSGGADTSLIEPPQPARPGEEATRPASEPAAAPEGETPAAPEGETPAEPAAIEQGTPRREGAQPAPGESGALQEMEALDLDGLEAEFEAARRLPAQQLDEALDELRAEFQRARDRATEEPVRRYIDQRLAWLDLRIETRDQRRQLQEALAQADERVRAIAARVDEIRRTQDYEIVGRLVPSTVYDGERLPLMYRVQSVGATVRTLGYIRPRPGLDLSGKIGEVVGIRGQTRYDEALKAAIVQPTEIDVLSPAG